MNVEQKQLSFLPRSPILPLTPDVAERIAAGEVIERPASVVKELLENALDAGAHEVRVEIRGGGLRLIRVIDDGYGIPEDELERACARHSTSKISAVEDLARLHGTTVTVRDLFYNVPARLKFMRGARTEAGHIVQLLQRYATGYPAVRFNLALEEHIALQTAGSGDVASTLAELYHLPLAELLTPVVIDAPSQHPFALHGYIGNRALAQNSRQHITLFINGRWIQSRPLQDALEAGYRSLLPKGKHPLLVFHIDLPAEEVDVNVHPTKTEVKLVQEARVAAVLTQAVRAVLERSPALPEAVQFPGPALVYQRRLPGSRRRGLRVTESASEYAGETSSPGAAEVLSTLRPLAQLQQAVILAEAPDGSLYLIDQHRAHERVIYEHLRHLHASGQHDEATDAHLLLEPVMIELKRHEAELFEQRLPILRGLGLECERFGGRNFLVRSVPGGDGQEQVAAHLHELAQLAAEDSVDWEDHLLIGLACRSALRRGRDLGLEEQRSLLTVLANTTAPAVCPHGSPILLHYSRAFLVDKFDW